MYIIIFIIATLFLFLGHLFKVYRWQQFIEIYEKPQTNNLLQSLSLSYIINLFVPFRIGDLFRAYFSGRKMKNGISFSLATIIIDRILDIIMVAIIFAIIYFCGFKNQTITNSVLFYSILTLIIFIIFLLAYIFNTFIKQVIKKIASIFNSNIELKILKVSWFGINSFKDIVVNMDLFKLIFNTILMWLFYLASYGLFVKTLEMLNYDYSFIEIFISLFSKNNLGISLAAIINNNSFIWIMFGFISLPLLYMFILSFFVKKSSTPKNNNMSYIELLPHVREQDKLTFLEAYFSGKSSDYFKIYMKLNQDISILQDFSAGSNATTLLCVKDKDTFFRKYSIGKDSSKLLEQANWLKEHNNLKVTPVLNLKYDENYCCYDMPYYNNAISYFNFVHSSPLEISWQKLLEVLNDLDSKLYIKIKKSSKEGIAKYIEEKVIKNIKKIESSNYIKPLLKYDILIINGKKYKNLNYFKKYLTKEYLSNLFANDPCSDIHGDLTIENIISYGKSYYIIDPNTNNLHESCFLDYSKLLQSLHGNYEFYMNTKTVQINENNINYLFTKSQLYEELYKKYDEFLQKKFKLEELKSIYFHEIIHWLRLLPYKIEKNGINSVLFYAGLIIILNDVIERFDNE